MSQATNLTTIAERAFENSKIEVINMSGASKLKTISDRAFNEVTDITSITMPTTSPSSSGFGNNNGLILNKTSFTIGRTKDGHKVAVSMNNNTRYYDGSNVNNRTFNRSYVNYTGGRKIQ